MRVAPCPCSQGWQAPALLLPLVALGREGCLLDTLERQSAVGVGDSGLYCLDLPLPDELLGGQRLQQPLHPQAFLLWKH